MPSEGVILEGDGWDVLHGELLADRTLIDLDLAEATSCWPVANFDGVWDRSQWTPTPKARLFNQNHSPELHH